MSQQHLVPITQSPYLLPPNIDLDHVSQYNENGKLLVPLIRDRGISERHHPFVLGLFAIYSIPTSLGYFTSADISWPPHSDFRRQDWLDIGFAPEVVDILELLPYLKDDLHHGGPVDIAWNAGTLSYLGGGKQHYRGVYGLPDLLEPTDFFVTCYGRGKLYYIYRSEYGTITAMDDYRHRFPNYRHLESYPAQVIMDNWLQNIHDLIYLPIQGKLEAQPVREFETITGSRVEPSYADLIAHANPADWQNQPPFGEDVNRNELNHFRAIRNLYQNFGWPNQFDREGFWSAFDDFQRKGWDCDKRLRMSNPQAFWPVPRVTSTPEEMEMRKEKKGFLLEAAGPLAIGRLT